MALAVKLRTFMDHPAGPKTVFFWAPAMKWVSIVNNLHIVRDDNYISMTK